jgi:hypothetical protein
MAPVRRRQIRHRYLAPNSRGVARPITHRCLASQRLAARFRSFSRRNQVADCSAANRERRKRQLKRTKRNFA